LAPRDLGDLAFFDVSGALVLPEEPARASAAAVRETWASAAAAARRLRKAGFRAVAAAALPPRAIPLRGLEALLADLPAVLDRPEVGAVGRVGLADGGELEERILVRQLELARELRLPVIASVQALAVGSARRRAQQLPVGSAKTHDRLTRRLLALLAEAELPAGRVLVLGADAQTVRSIRAIGQVAGLSLAASGEAPGGRGDLRAGRARGDADPLDAAVRLVRALGPEGIALASDAGLAGGDLLALPRAAGRLARAGLSASVIRRVCGGNARALLGLGT
jgi:predicted metal-dependent TIM-barrel fold hydrolase